MKTTTLTLAAGFGLSIATASPAIHAGTLLDLLTPHTGKQVYLTSRSDSTEVVLQSVGDDYFCARPAQGFDKCFSGSKIESVTLRTDAPVPLVIYLDLQADQSLPGTHR